MRPAHSQLTSTRETAQQGPLRGLRVLELGHFVAAPFAARLLADLGADVIKIEPRGGDPVRQWGAQADGSAPWWSLHGRNKRSVTIDLKQPAARELILSLASQCDAVIENFRPGYLAKLGLSDDALRSVRSDIVISHISGYGQDGPHRDRPAFGVIGEAVGGLRYLTNHPPELTNLPPTRVGLSIGDSLAGLYAAFGVMVSLYKRNHDQGSGPTVDVALTESILSITEGLLPEYAALNTVRQPAGGRIATAAPTNAYPTLDMSWILIAANSDRLFTKLAELMGRPDLVDDERFQGNRERVRHAAILDDIISAWTRTFTSDELVERLIGAEIPNTKVYTASDIAKDPQFRHRQMVQEVVDPHFPNMLHPGIVPHFPEIPGTIAWPGPEVGEHTEEILRELLDLSPSQITALRTQGVI